MLKYLPFIVIGLIAVPLTAYQWSMMDWVWGDNIPAQQCAYLLEKEIPSEIGDWVGVDQPVDEKTLRTAGADGYINRVYTNSKTKQQVAVWFIVGHFRQVSRHTPNVCYRNAGYDQYEKQVPYKFEVPDLPTSEFATTKFHKQVGGADAYERVFWAWWKPEKLEAGQSPSDVNIVWTAPEDPRLTFGFCRALYKLYFTSASTPEETPDESACIQFANEFLPIVHDRLRESGIVMGNAELPAGAEEILKARRESNEAKAGETVTPETGDVTENVPAVDAT
jgi:hypothetical protein